MLDLLPIDIWSNPDLKWLEPSAGNDNFIIIIYKRLVEGLASVIKNEKNVKNIY